MLVVKQAPDAFLNAQNRRGAKLVRPVHAQTSEGGKGGREEGEREDWERGRKETPGKRGGRGWDGNLWFSWLGWNSWGPWDPGKVGAQNGGVGLGKGWNPTRASYRDSLSSLFVVQHVGKLRLKPARMALLEPRCSLRPGGLGAATSVRLPGLPEPFSSQLWPVQAE